MPPPDLPAVILFPSYFHFLLIPEPRHPPVFLPLRLRERLKTAQIVKFTQSIDLSKNCSENGLFTLIFIMIGNKKHAWTEQSFIVNN